MKAVTVVYFTALILKVSGTVDISWFGIGLLFLWVMANSFIEEDKDERATNNIQQ